MTKDELIAIETVHAAKLKDALLSLKHSMDSLDHFKQSLSSAIERANISKKKPS